MDTGSREESASKRKFRASGLTSIRTYQALCLALPRGFAHGFAVRSDIADFFYKCDEVYSPSDEIAVRWNEEAVATLIRRRGADQAPVTDEDRQIGAYLSGRRRALPSSIALTLLDEMVMMSVQGGHVEAMRRLLDAGARVDGDPDSDEIPLGESVGMLGPWTIWAISQRARNVAVLSQRV